MTENENEFNSEYCNVKYVKKDNVVLLTWKKICCFEDYRQPTMFAANLLHKHSNSSLVIDARNGFEDEKADVEWGFSVLLPFMSKSDCKICVFVMSEISNIEGEIDLWSKEFMRYFEVKKVLTYGDAVRFIQGRTQQVDRIKLTIPTLEHQCAADAFKQAFFDCGETVINGSALLDQLEYTDWLENTQNNSDLSTVRKDWVVASTFFAVRQSDGLIVGMIDIRHNINNEFLSQYGGHIGYSVRPSERRKGYAAEMLQQALTYAGQLGLSEVMLGCYSDNFASQRTIEKCGGRLTETKSYLDGRMMNIYWIAL